MTISLSVLHHPDKIMPNNIVIASSTGNRQRRNKRKPRRSKRSAPRSFVVVRPPPPRPPRRQKRSSAKMSECALKYKFALSSPFSGMAIGACLPYAPDRDSLKAMSINRFAVLADASGNAFVLISPTIAADSALAWYNNTTGTIPITVVTANNAPANYGVAAPALLPYNTSDITAGKVEGRIVSVGLRVTYTGTISNMAGIYRCFVDPGHQNLNNATIATGATASIESCTRRVTQKPFEIGFGVTSDEEHAYRGMKDCRAGQVQAVNNPFVRGFYPWSVQDINGLGPGQTGYLTSGSAPIYFSVSGAVAGAPYYVEIIQHVEYVGYGAAYGLTPSHNDHNAANVIDATMDRTAATFGSESTTTWSQAFSKTLNQVSRDLGRNAGSYAGTAYRAYRSYKALTSRQSGALRIQ